jgi:hypothetical protein
VILNAHAAEPWADAFGMRLPGLRPLDGASWLIRDEAFAAQMALRDRLFSEVREACFAETAGSDAAQAEVLERVLAALEGDPGYEITPTSVRRPDGVMVERGRDRPLIEAARLTQEDHAVLAPNDPVNTLIAAALAFPASWTLAQKIGRPLADIHLPVKRIDPAMQSRIDKVIQRLPLGEPLWRANVLGYNDPSLHQPRVEGEHKPLKLSEKVYVRVERQSLTRLPKTGAALFSIHTSLWPLEGLPAEARALIAPVLKRQADAGSGPGLAAI